MLICDVILTSSSTVFRKLEINLDDVVRSNQSNHQQCRRRSREGGLVNEVTEIVRVVANKGRLAAIAEKECVIVASETRF